MRRCLQLARSGAGRVAPNPMVGAVLVYNDRILGEGYHRQYGEAHAEVNCLLSINEEDKHYISSSTLYVSLEPCAHFGKTPPCADLIIKHNIPRVVIGCRDPFDEVNGKGIEKLVNAGVEVDVGVLNNESLEINKRFFTYHTKHRPYIILKWAQTADGKMATITESENEGDRLLISNQYSNRLVHKWRSEEMSILVGTNTALADNPELTTRLWEGKNPIRLLIDKELKLPAGAKLFNGAAATIVFNLLKHSLPHAKTVAADLQGHTPYYYQLAEDSSLVHQVITALYNMGIQSVLVEGGAYLLQSFIDEGVWDEARVITNEQLIIGMGLPAAILRDHSLDRTEQIFSDTIKYYKNKAI
jgi:diaminohydroxyphosphoribosylaminopyrimidine deaminase / 5-amino-6-(5-phosphoribosylamino)uracil reductase